MDSAFEKERKQLYQCFMGLTTSNQNKMDVYVLDLFKFQYKYNETYRQFTKNLGYSEDNITNIAQIPYLPISAFKTREIKTGDITAQEIFKSSGTSGQIRSNHFIRDVQHYHLHTAHIWSLYFRNVETYCILGLLPGYLERDGSSLISMVSYFISLSQYAESGFYVREHETLYRHLVQCKNKNIPVVLFGVTYALLDFAAKYHLDFPELIIMETGGMKGNREEMTKHALHDMLKRSFGVAKVYSEYGMTELMSQAYTKGESYFYPNPFLKITTKQINDPLSEEKKGKPGIISIMDLANIDSCAFIQTEDLGMVYDDKRFEIAGRLDSADLRGCNLLLQETGLM
ncbi:MAG: acyl transferase [Saprospiraceae bacterium]|nr:acyl transferase [Saprospiraceae bacterium]